ncbi:MAG: hypothetical protein K6T26_07515 [Alicyclobacillus sp.]|nr:hypothetical protein [Alicyclobacillus sp.]
MSTQFIVFGVVVLGVLVWVAAQSSSEVAHLANMVLLVLLASMLVLHWSAIQPLFIKGGQSS